MEAPHNTDFHTWMGKKYFCFLQTAKPGNRTPNSGVKGNGANHYPRAPAQLSRERVHKAQQTRTSTQCWINVGLLSTRWTNIGPALGRCLVFAGYRWACQAMREMQITMQISWLHTGDCSSISAAIGGPLDRNSSLS